MRRCRKPGRTRDEVDEERSELYPLMLSPSGDRKRQVVPYTTVAAYVPTTCLGVQSVVYSNHRHVCHLHLTKNKQSFL